MKLLTLQTECKIGVQEVSLLFFVLIMTESEAPTLSILLLRMNGRCDSIGVITTKREKRKKR